MPQVIGIYRNNPNTAVLGVWFRLSNGNIVGRADSALPAVGGQTLAQYQAAVNTALQTAAGSTITVAVLISSIAPVTIAGIQAVAPGTPIVWGGG